MKTKINKETYESIEIAEMAEENKDTFGYVVTYSRGRGDSHSVGIKVSDKGDPLDYGKYNPDNYNKIRETVNEVIKKMHNDNYVYKIRVKKNYEKGVHVTVKAPNHELKVAHAYDNNSGDWWVENSDESFAMVPTDHYIEKYEDLVLKLAKGMYTEKELKNERELENGN